MNVTRVIGNNLQLELNNQNLDAMEAGRILGYSEDEFNKLLEGRLFVSPKEIKAIAEYFSIPEENLTQEKEGIQYRELIHNMGSSNDAAAIEQVLDFFDMYADLKEVVLSNK